MKNKQQPLNGTKTGKGAVLSLHQLFFNSLKDIYGAEKTLVKELPEMMEKASSPNLQSAIADHLAITENQVLRLEKIFDLLEEKPESEKCEALSGILKERNKMFEQTVTGPVRDAAIIASAQKIEHYEITSYGTLLAFAKVLGENDVAKLLRQTLAEELESDKILTDVANISINTEAL